MSTAQCPNDSIAFLVITYQSEVASRLVLSMLSLSSCLHHLCSDGSDLHRRVDVVCLKLRLRRHSSLLQHVRCRLRCLRCTAIITHHGLHGNRCTTHHVGDQILHGRLHVRVCHDRLGRWLQDLRFVHADSSAFHRTHCIYDLFYHGDGLHHLCSDASDLHRHSLHDGFGRVRHP
ncbi:hypothetical protein GN958_ATG16649 [Phytophthora infestans]|uniref:Uncharacterized protein n=1 Tax=Phytophthora infestans TaxID=4787 RepID=A0A8S9U5N8_PHYIN|nr:hypothetical protein GN958_ATG16649 [Phytophthora infestans]